MKSDEHMYCKDARAGGRGGGGVLLQRVRYKKTITASAVIAFTWLDYWATSNWKAYHSLRAIIDTREFKEIFGDSSGSLLGSIIAFWPQIIVIMVIAYLLGGSRGERVKLAAIGAAAAAYAKFFSISVWVWLGVAVLGIIEMELDEAPGAQGGARKPGINRLGVLLRGVRYKKTIMALAGIAVSWLDFYAFFNWKAYYGFRTLFDIDIDGRIINVIFGNSIGYFLGGVIGVIGYWPELIVIAVLAYLLGRSRGERIKLAATGIVAAVPAIFLAMLFIIGSAAPH